jgi:hypothetical protein
MFWLHTSRRTSLGVYRLNRRLVFLQDGRGLGMPFGSVAIKKEKRKE